MTRAAAAVVVLALAGPVAGQDDATLSPLDVIRDSNARMATVLRPNRTPTPAEVVRALDIIRAATDFAAVSRTVIGPSWEKVPADRQQDFIATFSEMVGRGAIARLGQYRADRIEYLGEDVTDDRAVVRTTATYEKKRIPLDYLMARTSAGWRIVDYRFNKVLTSENYRRQFERLLAKESFDQLLARLKKRLPTG